MLRGCFARIRFENGRYDINLLTDQGKRRRVEVKWDKRAGETGNLYFEVENTRQRKHSGIMATEADLWCHVVGEGGEALLARVDRLRPFLEQGAFRSVHTGGADSNSRGLLVARSRLRDDSFRWIRLPTVEEYFGELFRQADSGAE